MGYSSNKIFNSTELTQNLHQHLGCIAKEVYLTKNRVLVKWLEFEVEILDIGFLSTVYPDHTWQEHFLGTRFTASLLYLKSALIVQKLLMAALEYFHFKLHNMYF